MNINPRFNFYFGLLYHSSIVGIIYVLANLVDFIRIYVYSQHLFPSVGGLPTTFLNSQLFSVERKLKVNTMAQLMNLHRNNKGSIGPFPEK